MIVSDTNFYSCERLMSLLDVRLLPIQPQEKLEPPSRVLSAWLLVALFYLRLFPSPAGHRPSRLTPTRFLLPLSATGLAKATRFAVLTVSHASVFQVHALQNESKRKTSFGPMTFRFENFTVFDFAVFCEPLRCVAVPQRLVKHSGTTLNGAAWWCCPTGAPRPEE